VIRFNSEAESVRREGKLGRIAHAMGLTDASEIAEAIRDMSRRLGLPAGLTELGVKPDMFPRIVDGALADHSHNTNPRSAIADDYVRMLHESL
jgi:4-hydroxybutyrate dehydrogenase